MFVERTVHHVDGRDACPARKIAALENRLGFRDGSSKGGDRRDETRRWESVLFVVHWGGLACDRDASVRLWLSRACFVFSGEGAIVRRTEGSPRDGQEDDVRREREGPPRQANTGGHFFDLAISTSCLGRRQDLPSFWEWNEVVVVGLKTKVD